MNGPFYGIRILADISFVLSQFTHLTDGNFAHRGCIVAERNSVCVNFTEFRVNCSCEL